jgi:hypothetical protein
MIIAFPDSILKRKKTLNTLPELMFRLAGAARAL